MNGQEMIPILESVLQFFPLDKYVDDHAIVMKLVDSDQEKLGIPPIWKDFNRILTQGEEFDNKCFSHRLIRGRKLGKINRIRKISIL